MVASALDVPYEEADSMDPDYSPEVRDALEDAYHWLGRAPGDREAYREAAARVEPLAEARMGRAQRMRVHYLLAMGHAAANRHLPAIAEVDKALDIALELKDDGACAKLLLLRGAAHRAESYFADAAQDYEDCLTFVRRLQRDGDTSERVFELGVVAHLVGYSFFNGKYERAKELVRVARALEAKLGQDEARIERATLDWMESHLHRWSGDAARALELAERATGPYAELGSVLSRVRLRSAVIEAALDAAERTEANEERTRLLRLASESAAAGLREARRAHDNSGWGLVRLGQLRAWRLRGLPGDRIGPLRAVVRLARREGDLALEAQAMTALGDELAAQGRVAADPPDPAADPASIPNYALDCWRRARALLRNLDVPALDVWPLRAIERYTR